MLHENTLVQSRTFGLLVFLTFLQFKFKCNSKIKFCELKNSEIFTRPFFYYIKKKNVQSLTQALSLTLVPRWSKSEVRAFEKEPRYEVGKCPTIA